MKRISTATRVVDKFGVGKPGFTNGNAVTGVPATDLEADWFDNVQEELAALVEANADTVDGSSTSQVLAALQAMFSSVVGLNRNVQMSLDAVASIATWTADQIVVKSALNGRSFILTGLNQALNLATVGENGMDAGAPPNNGYVAVYVIYNPALKKTSLLARNATAGKVGEVYGGVNMPAGFTASALISVYPTDATGKFVVGYPLDRKVARSDITVATNVTAVTYQSVSISAAAPPNANRVRGKVRYVSSPSNAGGGTISVAAKSSGIGREQVGAGGYVNMGVWFPFEVDIITSQTFYIGGDDGTVTANNILVNRYWF